MQIEKYKYWLFLGAGMLDILILDFVTKLFVNKGIIQEFVFIRDFFYLTSPHKNDGIAFGIDLPMPLQIFGSIVILYLLYRLGSEYISTESKPSIWKYYLLGAVIGGGLGNLIDRILYGHVVDFIVLKPIPVFNVADIGITVGLVLLFVTILIDQRRSKI